MGPAELQEEPCSAPHCCFLVVTPGPEPDPVLLLSQHTTSPPAQGGQLVFPSVHDITLDPAQRRPGTLSSANPLLPCPPPHPDCEEVKEGSNSAESAR